MKSPESAKTNANIRKRPVKSAKKPAVKWDDSKIRTTYANICNVFSTREEVTLLFGTNQTWRSGQGELKIDLSDRMILNPYTAKRLALFLNNVVQQYEKRYGELQLGPDTQDMHAT